MTEKRMNSKLKGVHNTVSTSGLNLLARIIARYHLSQSEASNSVSSVPPACEANTVHPAVPRGQAGGQAGGQVDGQEDGHSKKEGSNGPAQPDLDPAI